MDAHQKDRFYGLVKMIHSPLFSRKRMNWDNYGPLWTVLNLWKALKWKHCVLIDFLPTAWILEYISA
jgi:hypothetical protein